MHKANVNYNVLKENLTFLIKQGLVEEHTIRIERTVFTVTQRGITVLKYFRELTQALPISEVTLSQKSSSSDKFYKNST